MLNSLCLPSFYRRSDKATFLLYLVASVTDILTCLCCLPSAISMVYSRDPVLLSSPQLCILTGFLFNVSSRMSVFVVATLSVVRWMTICDLVPRPTNRNILLSVLLYLLFQVAQAALPLFFSTKSPPIYFAPQIGACSWGLPDLDFLEYNTAVYNVVSYSLVIITWVLPAVPVFICSGYILMITIKHRSRMCRYRKPSISCNPGSHLQQLSASVNPGSWAERAAAMSKASITIVIYTVTYAVFNVPIWLCILVVLLSIEDHIAFIGNVVYVNIFLSRLSVVMNAAVNPVIYILRLSEVKEDLAGLVSNVIQHDDGPKNGDSRDKTLTDKKRPRATRTKL